MRVRTAPPRGVSSPPATAGARLRARNLPLPPPARPEPAPDPAEVAGALVATAPSEAKAVAPRAAVAATDVLARALPLPPPARPVAAPPAVPPGAITAGEAIHVAASPTASALDPQLAADAFGPLALPAQHTGVPPSPLVMDSPQRDTPQPAAERADERSEVAASDRSTTESPRPENASPTPRTDLWAFLSHLMPAVPSPFAWPRMPGVVQRWVQQALGDGMADLVAVVVVAMAGIVGAGAMRSRRLAHMDWRTRTRRYRPAFAWSTLEPAPEHGVDADIAVEALPTRELAPAAERRDPAAPSRRRHAA